MNRSLLLAGAVAAAFSLTACDQVFQPSPDSGMVETETVTLEPVPAETGEAELPVRPESTSAGATIDWDAARRDLAARSLEDEGSFQAQSGGDQAPPVPVFLPSAPISIQGGESGVRYQPTSDGYYAFFPGEAYDTIVNGTNVVITAPGATAAPRTDSMKFEPTTTGAMVAFSRYGADYLVEFECKELVEGMPQCISETEALAFAQDLAISGTR